MPFRTLVLMHTESNAGFAIAPLESTFYGIGVELGGGMPGSVHFAFPSMARGYPSNLPPGVPVLETGSVMGTESTIRIVDYVRTHGIEFVLAFDLQPSLPLFRELRRAGARCIVSYWGAEISSRNPFWKRLLKRALLAISRSKLDGLVFESQAMADLARYGRGVPQTMIDVVPLGIDISKFSAKRTEYVYEQFGIPPHHRIVVYAGHMESRKGVRFLIEAAVRLLVEEGRTDVTFLLFGDRPGERDAFLPLYAGRHIDSRIIFAGYRSDLHLCFSGCSIGVIPSSGWDSFPRTSIELAASGLPLVVSDLGGLPETIVDGCTGLLAPPGDPNALARQLARLLDDQPLARRMGQAGRQRCEEHFTLDVQYSRLLQVLRQRTEAAGLH